jgi:hypothetical protein
MRPYFAKPSYRGKPGNSAVVPASMLPYKEQWQAAANSLPKGTVLVVLPRANGTARQSAEMVARYLRAEGRMVSVMAAERLAPSPIPYSEQA